ncbi:unnamed protein product [Spirodela intermedia]|uniref:Uncharacterized protein n=1 Tax=Spirodela intermedia TaxID=51605 RepID=A0A7I8LLN5_SPIIN|nr:unnamed protein product [Spirodela intermedia]
MADVGATRGCSGTCGCPNPCPGGEACRCATGGRVSGAQHSVCSCGEHCSCNPCECGKSGASSGAGVASCTCGSSCRCDSCAS